MICLTKAGMIEISGGEEARMPRKNSRNTKGRIIAAAWKLFYEQGFEETTIEDIVYESETSKGSFYHYFKGKDELMGTLANVFDEKYEQLMVEMDPGLDAMENLRFVLGPDMDNAAAAAQLRALGLDRRSGQEYLHAVTGVCLNS